MIQVSFILFQVGSDNPLNILGGQLTIQHAVSQLSDRSTSLFQLGTSLSLFLRLGLLLLEGLMLSLSRIQMLSELRSDLIHSLAILKILKQLHFKLSHTRISFLSVSLLFFPYLTYILYNIFFNFSTIRSAGPGVCGEKKMPLIDYTIN